VPQDYPTVSPLVNLQVRVRVRVRARGRVWVRVS
jgi:hypothetical protein